MISKFDDLMTRQLNSKGGHPFSGFFTGDTDDIRKKYECQIFFHLSFTGDTGDMKSLKIYTNVQEKPESAGLLTRQFHSKGVILFLDFFLLVTLVTLMTSKK